jgi:hypothetical protein
MVWLFSRRKKVHHEDPISYMNGSNTDTCGNSAAENAYDETSLA